MRAGWMTAFVTALLAGAAQAADWSLALTVEEPAGMARVAEPVSGGVPLMPGQFRPDQPFVLYEGEREVPVQALPLVVDEKGFLRWVLLDFQVDLKAKEKKTLTLRAARGTAQVAPALKVTKDAQGVTVETGTATFTIAADKPFSLFTRAAAGGRPVLAGGEVSYTDGLEGRRPAGEKPAAAAAADAAAARPAPADAVSPSDFDGKKHLADRPSSIEVEYAGPLRATVCVKGPFVGDADNAFRYIARITAWAGKSAVHVKYSLANSNEAHYTYRLVQDSTITLRLAARPESTVLGASKPIEAPGDAWMHQSMRVVPAVVHSDDVIGYNPWLRQTPGADGPGGCTAQSGEKTLWTSQGKGDVAEGWLAVAAGGARLWVTDLYFVEDPPRRMAVAGDTVALTGVTTPLAGTKPPFGETVRWLFDCSHLSSEYVIDLAGPAGGEAASAAARRARGPLHVLAPLAWYFQTDALPVSTFGTLADEIKCYETWGWTYAPADVTAGLVGQLARVNRYVVADDNHFVSEQDTLEGLFLMYLRTGKRAFYDAAQAWANYFMDLNMWRTDGWRWKDGGVWWHGGPAGNRPQRAADPVTGLRNSLPAEWSQELKTKRGTFGPKTAKDVNLLFLAKSCHCHNWGEGLAQWFLITGDRDAFEAAMDAVELNYDTQRRAFRKVPGQATGFSRDFTRSCYLTNAARLIAPTDPYVVEASDYLAAIYLKRPNPEPRGFLNGPAKVTGQTLAAKTGPNGLARMKELGITLDEKTGELVDPRTGARWMPVADPHTWMFPPLSRAMETYYRQTGNEDALDWLVAYGQAVAHVLYQEKHGTFNYSHLLVDFPTKGFAWDRASWALPPDAKSGSDAKDTPGAALIRIDGYQAMFHPDIPARAYELSGEPFLKQRAADYYWFGTHPGVLSRAAITRPGRWVNVYSTHDESVCFTGKTFYIWAHPKPEERPAQPVADLAVKVDGDKAAVTFTAPADEGGGQVVRYQVKCSDRPIVDYATFLKMFAQNTEKGVTNWWMATNLTGEPAPKAAGTRESFTVSGVPASARYFAVCTFDDSGNRSAVSNVAEAAK